MCMCGRDKQLIPLKAQRFDEPVDAIHETVAYPDHVQANEEKLFLIVLEKYDLASDCVMAADGRFEHEAMRDFPFPVRLVQPSVLRSIASQRDAYLWLNIHTDGTTAQCPLPQTTRDTKYSEC